jgi:hypothetical protein
MAPPIWLDEDSPRLPTVLCRKCDREQPVHRWTVDVLLANRWEPCRTFRVVEWWETRRSSCCGRTRMDGGCW